MDITHCVVLRYLSLNGLTPKEIHEDMMVTSGRMTLQTAWLRIGMLNSTVAVVVRKTTPVEEDQPQSPHWRSLTRFMTLSWQTDE